MQDAMGPVRILTSRTVLGIYCKLSSEYLTIEDIVRNVAKNSKPRLKVELGVENFSSLFILLSIKEEAWNLEITKSTIKALSL